MNQVNNRLNEITPLVSRIDWGVFPILALNLTERHFANTQALTHLFKNSPIIFTKPETKSKA